MRIIRLTTGNVKCLAIERTRKNMKHSLIVPLLAILCLGLSLPAGAQNVTPRVGICNPAKVFSDCQEVKDLRAKMEQQQKLLGQQKLERQQKLKDIQNARDALKPDAPAYGDKNRELVQAAIEYKTWEQITQLDADREQKQQMLSIFNRITAIIAEVATSKQVDVVIAEQRPELPENLEQITLDQLRAVIISRNVLFSNPAIDITNDVTAAMDAKYKAGS